MRKSFALGCLWPFLLLPIAGLAIWLLRVPIMRAAGEFLVEDDGPHHADALVVLGGDEYGERSLLAARLAKEGYAPYVLVSFPYTFGDCGNGATFAESKGYPASLFRELPNHAKSTREEAELLDRYFHQHGIHSILLATSNYHTRRAAYLIRHQDPALQVWVEPAPDPGFTAANWWQTREGQKTFLMEWIKTFAAWLGD